MTIRVGGAWGERGALAPTAPIAEDNLSARRALQLAFDADPSLRDVEIGLLGGDLHRTLGSPARSERDLRAGSGMRFPMDVGVVHLDGGPPLVFLAHLIGVQRRSRPLWHSRTITAMNACFVGESNLGPRAHPNDGRLDVVDGTVPRSDRRQANRRSITGDHVPHPALAERRVRRLSVDAAPGVHVRLDGELVGRASAIELECRPDAITVVA